jgi:outer membrane biosynthesis protein TonB
MRRNAPFHRGATLLLLLAIVFVVASRLARADELKLKDGSKIVGTIVGFEDNSFKVKTSFGYAVVQKDQVVSISVSDAPKISAEKKPDPVDPKTSAPEKPKQESAAVPAPPAAKPAVNANPSAQPVAAKNVAPAPTPAPTSSAPPPVANVALHKPAEPETIREQVVGNTYTNETYRFQMYKPPDWELIAAARALLPGSIAALGTDDDTTYLLIGQQPAGKSVASDMDAAERRLRDVMENFRPLAEEHTTVAGSPATEHHFRGSVDQHEWSGVIVLVSRGPRVYTIFGMTRADSDLVQIQENIIARAISSLQFTE